MLFQIRLLISSAMQCCLNAREDQDRKSVYEGSLKPHPGLNKELDVSPMYEMCAPLIGPAP